MATKNEILEKRGQVVNSIKEQINSIPELASKFSELNELNKALDDIEEEELKKAEEARKEEELEKEEETRKEEEARKEEEFEKAESAKENALAEILVEFTEDEVPSDDRIKEVAEKYGLTFEELEDAIYEAMTPDND